MVLVLFVSPGIAYQLTLHNDRITLHADQVRLQTLMNDLAKKTGVKVVIDPGLNPYISANFNNKSLQNALESIIPPLNHALKWESAIASVSGASRIRLAEIHIFKEGSPHQMLPRKKNSPLDIARNPEDGYLYVKGEILIRLKPGLDVKELNKILKQLGGTLISETRLDFNPLPDGIVPIAVLDSGLAPGNLPGEYLLATQDSFNPDDPISDPLGHGTQMALIAAGIVTPFGAKKNTDSTNPVIAIRTFDENGYTSSTALIQGIDYALANGARVASLSWGSSTKSQFINDTLEYGASKGLIIVASAGNEPTGRPVYPAAYDSVIGIGALAPDGQHWENSNYGNFVDAYLPGFADMPVGYKADPGIYAGTSISAAFAANQIAAFLSQNPILRLQSKSKNIPKK